MSEVSKPIRVAQMMTDMNYGGVEMVVMNYYRHIDRTKVQFDFIVLEGSSIPQREEIEELGGRIYVVPRYTHLFQYEKAIQKIFRENQYQIVHSHMNTLSVFSLWGGKKAGVPNRIIHNHSTAGKGETKKNIMKYALRPFAKMNATQLCACSRHAGEWMFGRNTEFKVIHNAIDLERYKYNEAIRNELRKELGLEDKFVVGHIGRFCFQKNHDFLIDIFDEIYKRREDAVLMLIGEGEMEDEIRRKVYHLGLDDRVLFLGKRKDTYRYYQAMDVFLLPSRYEGLGMVAIEAQVNGLVTICSTEVPSEVAVTELTSFISLVESAGRWAEAVIALGEKYKRRDTCEDLRKAGFDIKIEAGKLEELYFSF